MPLPGGLWHRGELLHRYAFRPLTGAVELAIAEAASGSRFLPGAVTLALAASLESLGDLLPEPELVDDLCVGDRQFLMQQLAILLGLDEVWMTAVCPQCGAQFDFLIRFSELPVKGAGATYPFARVNTSLGPGCWRVPCGADQKHLAMLPAGEDGGRPLARLCLVECPASQQERDPDLWVASLTATDLAQIETALGSVAPEVTLAVQAACPDCGQTHKLGIDPYFCLYHQHGDILAQVHNLATVYHWSEAEILSLPQRRRQRYLHLIDRSRGLVG
ncbi:MAG: hypothetical protein ACOZFS_04950 [Thermodesulfobacteriota bacterium]